MASIGSMRHRVEIQARTDTRDASGQAIPSYATQATVWAKVRPLSTREAISAQQINADSNTMVEMRYQPNVTPLHRLLHRGRTLEIVSAIDRDDRRIWLDVICVEARS